ncbi:MAG TPA: DUF2760 domain-containing protein [Polyangiaceae bacterium]|nr:DUF2760 domain-containing protein [Polyangiaceae bacterium]
MTYPFAGPKLRAVTESTHSSAGPLSFLERFLFAWQCLFRIWFDGEFALRLKGAARGFEALPSPDASSPSDRDEPVESDDTAVESQEPSKEAESVRQEAEAQRAREAARVGALQLLGLLQREGRFVDFVQQEIAKFSDAEIGAAARVVHAGCRKALLNHARVEPARPENEGARLTLDADFDRGRLKLTGNVGGKPPYQGTLRHRGWIVSDLALPILVEGYDARVVAAAEVEL